MAERWRSGYAVRRAERDATKANLWTIEKLMLSRMTFRGVVGDFNMRTIWAKSLSHGIPIVKCGVVFF